MLALNKYMEQLTDPKITFSVRQQHPKTVTEAVLATIELETYLPMNDILRNVGTAAQSMEQKHQMVTFEQQLTDVIGALISQIEVLEYIVKQQKVNNISKKEYSNDKHSRQVTCHKCGQCGHYAKSCAINQGGSHTTESKVAIQSTTDILEQNQRVVSCDVNTITINCVSNYSLKVCIKGVWISFLVDTGATVSLVNGRVWDSIKDALKLNPVGMRLVGVDGAPLQVRGSKTVRFSVCGLTIEQKFIVADSRKLSAGGQSIPLDFHFRDKKAVAHTDVTAAETVTISPVSEMEIMGNMSMECTGTWLVEGRVAKKPPIFVARAVTPPQQDRLPIRMLNLSSKSITIYKGTRIAMGESVEHDIAAISALLKLQTFHLLEVRVRVLLTS